MNSNDLLIVKSVAFQCDRYTLDKSGFQADKNTATSLLSKRNMLIYQSSGPHSESCISVYNCLLSFFAVLLLTPVSTQD